MTGHVPAGSWVEVVVFPDDPWLDGRHVPSRPGHQAQVRWGEVWLDVVQEPWTAAEWRYRRDHRITRPLGRAIRRVGVGGVDVPVMAPETVLLFKATTGGRTTPRPKDDVDLPRALPALDAEARAWLRAALPAGHPWRARIAGATD